MYGKKNKANEWYKTACKLHYRKHKLAEPYGALLEYYEAVSWTHGPIRGHFDFFSLAKMDKRLDELVKELRSALPADLIDNFNAALDKFVSLGDDPEYDDVVSAFDDYDDCADEHIDEITAIIESYITEMKEKHYI